MAKFQVLNGSGSLFSTDDEGMLRSFLAHPGSNSPGLSQDLRVRLTALLTKLPEPGALADGYTVEEQTGAFHERIKIVFGGKRGWWTQG
jgi:hypothetical protein